MRLGRRVRANEDECEEEQKEKEEEKDDDHGMIVMMLMMIFARIQSAKLNAKQKRALQATSLLELDS